MAWVAAGVSKENVSPDQPRSSPLASAFDATAEIFTTFDLVFRRDSPRPLIGGPWPRPAHVRVTRSPEHYQPLCMPDASTLMRRYAYTCIYAFTCTCTYTYTYMRKGEGESRRLHGYIREYIRPIHRRRDVYTGWGFVREAAVGFRYDTVDRTARIFGIGALSLAKISVCTAGCLKNISASFASACNVLADLYIRNVSRERRFR